MTYAAYKCDLHRRMQPSVRETADISLYDVEHTSECAGPPGMDQICYLMINHLSELSKDVLLKMYNNIWEEGKLPQSWKEAVIFPIRKPGKDCTNPGNYRPIALTSNIGKIMEKL